jgi:hypothetical protein
VTQFRSAGIRPAQDRVAAHLGRSTNTLRSWIRHYFRCEWDDVLAWSDLDWDRMMQR